MSVVDTLAGALVVVGVFFFASGSLGLLRLPDTHTRLHALTKADNVGLGFVVAGLLVGASAPGEAVRLVLVWLLTLASGATTAFLIARAAWRDAARRRDDDAG